MVFETLQHVVPPVVSHVLCLPQEECLVLEKHFLVYTETSYSDTLSLSLYLSLFHIKLLGRIFSFIFLTTECILEIAIHTRSWKCFQVFSGSLLAHFLHYGLLVAPLQVLRVFMLTVYPFPLNTFLRGDLTSHLNTSVCSICCILVLTPF